MFTQMFFILTLSAAGFVLDKMMAAFESDTIRIFLGFTSISNLSFKYFRISHVAPKFLAIPDNSSMGRETHFEGAKNVSHIKG